MKIDRDYLENCKFNDGLTFMNSDGSVCAIAAFKIACHPEVVTELGYQSSNFSFQDFPDFVNKRLIELEDYMWSNKSFSWTYLREELLKLADKYEGSFNEN